MRVIAGELKGRPLLAPRGWKVRPTSDRVREAIFSALGRGGRRGPRPRPLLRHRGAGDRGALARRRRGGPRRPRHPAGARQRREPRPLRAAPSWSAPTPGAGWRRGPRTRPRRDSTSSSSMPHIDSPTAWGRNSTPSCPAFSTREGGPSSRAAPAARCASSRWSGCASAATAPPTSPSTAIGVRAGERRPPGRHGRLPGQLRPGHQRPPRHHHPHLRGLRAGRRRRRQQPDPQAEDAVHRRGAQGVHRGGDRPRSTTSRCRSSPTCWSSSPANSRRRRDRQGAAGDLRLRVRVRDGPAQPQARPGRSRAST